MKKCEYCGNPIVGKKKTARFCCDFCRLKAFRGKNGSKYQSRGESALNVPENKHLDAPQQVKSFTCCENARFYSPAAKWGEVLICDNCGAVWERKI
jgi:hypothetical protein